MNKRERINIFEINVIERMIQLELKRLLLGNRVLNANDYANIRAYSAVLKQFEREGMYV